jgi:predicted choloylglycine hydrolase
MTTVVVRALSETQPGPIWAAEVASLWPAYRAWYFKDGVLARPTYLAGERALRQHMPELLPLYNQLVTQVKGGDLFARVMSSWCPPAYATGCSQAVWLHGEPLLVRTYDYAPTLWDGVVLRTEWLGRTVVGTSDSLWGLLDGINDAGLAVSLAFGGRRVVGPGFGIPLIIRYLLQVCTTTEEAVGVLNRMPCHMAYTVTVVDTHSHSATVFLSPDRPAQVTANLAATNHQLAVEWPEHALSTGSVERLAEVANAAADPTTGPDGFINRFLEPTVWSTQYAKGAGTLYGACYAPHAQTLTMLWPKQRWTFPISGFEPGSRTIKLA